MNASPRRSLLPRLLAVALTACVACGECAAQANVVFGNLGADGNGTFYGDGELGMTGTGATFYALGFTGTTPYLSVTSVKMALTLLPTGTTAASTAVAARIYQDATNSPGSVLATSTAVQVANTPGVHEFTFSNAVALTAGNTYWVAPFWSGAPAEWMWNLAADDSDPRAQNGSGWMFVGATTSTDGGATWSQPVFNDVLSLSVTAVPEPSATVLVGMAMLATCGAAAGRSLRRVLTRAPANRFSTAAKLSKSASSPLLLRFKNE